MQRKFLAAAVAIAPLLGLAAGAASAATTISGSTSTPVATATVKGGAPDDIIITGSITPTSPGAAVTLNSNNSVTNQGSVNFKDVNNAVGILVEGGFTGQVISTGSIVLNETYVATLNSNNDGLPSGAFAQGDDRFGIQVTGTAPFNGSVTATGGITIQGMTSAAIDLEAPITGSLLMLTVTPPTTSGGTPTVVRGTINVTGEQSIGLNVASGAGVGGDVLVTGVTAAGPGVRAVVIDGAVGGQVNISGAVTSTGYRSTTRQTIPTIASLYTADQLEQGGPTVTIGGNVAKGVIISAPPFPLSTTVADQDGDGVPDNQQGTGTISQFAAAPAVLIGAASGGVELGMHGAGANAYGFIIQGSVSANGLFDPFTSPNLGAVVPATAIQIGGLGGPVTVDGGVHVSGAVSATSYQANATGIHVGATASGATTVPSILNDGAITAISNQVVTTLPGATGAPAPVTVDAILIDKGANVTAITNTNSIGATIIGTSGVGGSAGGIIDNSGSVAAVNNMGNITAALSQTVVAAPMPGVTTAIDLSQGTVAQTITQSLSPQATAATVYSSSSSYKAGALVTESTTVPNNTNNTIATITTVYEASAAVSSGTGQDPLSAPLLWRPVGPAVPSITGDIRFGSGGSTLTVDAGTITSNIIDMGAGTNTININGPAGTSVSGSVLLGPANTGQISLNLQNGQLSDTNPIAVKAGSINAGAGGVLLVAADPAKGTNTDFIASGVSTFATGAQVGLTLASLQAAPVATYVILQTAGAGTLSAGTFGANQSAITPYLYTASPSYVPSTVAGQPSEIQLTVTRRTAAQLGFDKAEASALTAVLTALPNNTAIEQTVLAQTTQAGLKGAYDQLLPNQGQGIFEAIDAAAEAVSSMTATRPDAGTPVATPSSLWLQEVNQRIDRHGVDTLDTNAKLIGLVGGYEHTGFAGGALGFTLSYFNAQEEESQAAVGQHVLASLVEAGAYWRREMGPFTFDVRGAGGYGWFSGVRKFVAPEVVDTATSSWSGVFADAHAGVSYEHKLFGRYYARPEVTADYLYLTEGAHQESGGGPGFDLNIASRASSRASAEAVMVLGAQYGTSSWLRPEIRFGYREIFAGQVGDTQADFLDGSPFILASDQERGGWATVGFSLKAGTPYSYVALEGDLDYRSGQERYDIRIAGRSALTDAVMSPLAINAVGAGAAVCSMTSFAPQLVKIWRERDASAVSLRMYVVTVTGFALWTAYGVFIGRWPLVASNTVCLVMAAAVLALKLKFDRAPR